MAGVDETPHQSLTDRLPSRLADLLQPAIILPTTAITISEIFLYSGYTDLALWAHFITLFACVLAPLQFDDIPMFQVFALLPLFRLVNLGMPVFIELTIYWFPLVYAPLFPAVYVVQSAVDTPNISFAPKVLAIALVPGIVMGAFLANIEYAIIEPQSLIPAWDVANVAFITLVMIGFVGLVEELVYRGLLQPSMQDRIGRWGGLLLSAALFGLMHSAYASPAEIAFAGGIGLLFGLIYEATESILLVTVIHGVLNVFLFAVIPIHGGLLGWL